MAQEGIYRRIYDMQARIEVELEQEMTRVELQTSQVSPPLEVLEGG